jgi:hypothetical protein
VQQNLSCIFDVPPYRYVTPGTVPLCDNATPRQARGRPLTKVPSSCRQTFVSALPVSCVSNNLRNHKSVALGRHALGTHACEAYRLPESKPVGQAPDTGRGKQYEPDGYAACACTALMPARTDTATTTAPRSHKRRPATPVAAPQRTKHNK